jgi:hypothetical protein
VGSNPTQGMDVCVCVYSVFVFFCVLVAALRWAEHSSKESYRLCKNDYETEEEARAQQKAVEPLMKEKMNEFSFFLSFKCLFYIILYYGKHGGGHVLLG